jgi:ketosteroid isomerase-like protein
VANFLTLAMFPTKRPVPVGVDIKYCSDPDGVQEWEAMDTRAEIEKLTANFAKAVTNRDFAALGDFYEERARLLAPGASMVEGRAAIQAAQQSMIEGGVVQALRLDVIDVIEAGDFVIEIGRTTLTIQPPGAESVIENGKSVVVWRRQKDGALKIAVDMFNSDAPAS